MEEEHQKAVVAGQQVNLVVLDLTPTSATDYNRIVRFHFVPRVGEEIEIEGRLVVVERILHKVVEDQNSDLGHFAMPNLVCRPKKK